MVLRLESRSVRVRTNLRPTQEDIRISVETSGSPQVVVYAARA